VIIEVWLSGSEATMIRRSALVQKLSRNGPQALLVVVEGQGGILP